MADIDEDLGLHQWIKPISGGDRLASGSIHGNMLPVARPLLPTAERLKPYLDQMDQSRWYSNAGPLVRDLERRIVEHFGDDNLLVKAASSGTPALWAALVALCRRSGGFCLMPSWTFGATAAAALHAGLIPYFLDVEEDSWALDPEQTAKRAKELQAAAIVPVFPFGAPIDLTTWADVAKDTGAKVVIDAAAGFDTLSGLDGLGDVPIMVSLHATKVLPAGEGGILISKDPEVDIAVRRLLNFGFRGDRVAREPGFNGKMSEYHAAVGLASLAEWEEDRTDWLATKALCRRSIGPIEGVQLGPDAAGDHACTTFNVVTHRPAEEMRTALAERGVGALRWWGAGCRAQPAYYRCPADPLPVTRHLSEHTVGLPLWRDMPATAANHVAEALVDILADHGVEALYPAAQRHCFGGQA